MKRRVLTAIATVLISIITGVGTLYLLEERSVNHEGEEGKGERGREEQQTAALPEPPPPPRTWNTYHGDSALRGAPEGALSEKLELRWRYKAGAPVRGTPVSEGEWIFFATARGEVIATDLNAQRLWSRELLTGEMENGVAKQECVEAPVACFDGLLLVATMRGMLYGLDTTSGDEKWHAEIEGTIMGTANYLPPMANQQSGSVYVIGRAEGVLHCLDANSGHILWRSEPIARCDGSPSVTANVVVFGSCAAALHVFSPDTGKLLRDIDIDEDSQVAGGVAIDGNSVFSGCRSGKVIHADINTGQMVWTNTDNQAEAFATPAVTQEWVVASSSDGNVMAIERATGKLRWRFDTKGNPSSPVIANDKVVVAADGELFLLKLTDGVLLWSLKVSDEITSPAVMPGIILVGSEDGTVVAFGAASE